MKKLAISLAATSILLLGALVFVLVNPFDSASAQNAETAKSLTEIESADDAVAWASDAIDALLDAGLLTEETADLMRIGIDRLEALDLDSFNFDDLDLGEIDLGELGVEEFDTEGFAFDLDDLRKRFETFDFGDLDLESLPKWDDRGDFGFGFLDDFNTEWFQTEMLANAESFLDKLVEDGILTQDEADEKLAHLMEMMKR